MEEKAPERQSQQEPADLGDVVEQLESFERGMNFEALSGAPMTNADLQNVIRKMRDRLKLRLIPYTGSGAQAQEAHAPYTFVRNGYNFVVTLRKVILTIQVQKDALDRERRAEGDKTAEQVIETLEAALKQIEKQVDAKARELLELELRKEDLGEDERTRLEELFKTIDQEATVPHPKPIENPATIEPEPMIPVPPAAEPPLIATPIEAPKPHWTEAEILRRENLLVVPAQNAYRKSPPWNDHDATERNRILSSIETSMKALARSDIEHPEQLIPFFLGNFHQEKNFAADSGHWRPGNLGASILSTAELTALRGYLNFQNGSIIDAQDAAKLDAILAQLPNYDTEAELAYWNRQVTGFFLDQIEQHGIDAVRQKLEETLAELKDKAENGNWAERKMYQGAYQKLKQVIGGPFMQEPDPENTGQEYLDMKKVQRNISRRINTFGKAQKNVDILMETMRNSYPNGGSTSFLDIEIARLQAEHPKAFQNEQYGAYLSPDDYMRNILIDALTETPGAIYSPMEIEVIVFNYHYKPILDRFDDNGDGLPEPENMHYVFAELNGGNFSVRNSAIQARLNQLCPHYNPSFTALEADGDLTAYDGVVPRYWENSNTVKALTLLVTSELSHIQGFAQQIASPVPINWNDPVDIVRSFVELSKSDDLEKHPLYEYLMFQREGERRPVSRRMIPDITIINEMLGITSGNRTLHTYCELMDKHMRYYQNCPQPFIMPISPRSR